MPAYKDEASGRWYANFYYTDWQGKKVHKKKRGFERKKDAQAWEAEFLRSSSRSCDMLFQDFVDIYFQDMAGRLRENRFRN